MNVQVLVFRHSSDASQVTMVGPIGKVEPLGGVHATLGFVEQLSLAVAVHVILLRVVWPVSVASVWLVGQVILGGVMSTTVMV